MPEHWDPIDIAWAAGLIEGEGSVLIMKHQTVITVSMTDADVVHSLVARLGIGRVTGPYGPYTGEKRKPIWRWVITDRRSVARLLLAIAPLMGSRRKASITEVTAAIHDLNLWMASRLCKQCGDEFAPVSFYAARRQLFCTTACTQLWHRNKKKVTV